MIGSSPLAEAFWRDGRCDDCPVYDMHGHMGAWHSIYFPRPEASDMIDVTRYSPDYLKSKVPEVFERAASAQSIDEVRQILFQFAHRMQLETFEDYDSFEEGSIIRVRDCARALIHIVTRRSEHRAGFSVTQALWDIACGKSPHRRVRLWIDPDAPELHALPWELLHDGKTWLAADAATPFSRYLPSDVPWGGLITGRPIRILSVISTPADLAQYNLAPLDVDAERALLTAALGDLAPAHFHLEHLDTPATLERLERALASAPHVLLHHPVQIRVADHHDVLVALGQHASPCHSMGVTIDDHLDGFLGNRTEGLKHEFAIVLGIPGVESDEAVFGLDDAHGGEPITPKNIYPLGRILDGRFEPVEVADAIKQLFGGDGPVGGFGERDRGAHVRGV